MENKEYEAKKHECWEEYKRENLDGEVQWQPVSRYDVFCAAFDRAYALGKLQASCEQVKEGISQEEIEKAAIEYVLTRQQARHNAKKEEDATMRDFDKTIKAWDAYDMEQAFESGANLFLGKQEKDADTVIQGWVARDEDGTLTLFYGSDKPSKKDNDDYWSAVFGNTLEYLPQEMFPDVTWNDPEPTRVEIIIKRKKKNL